MTGDHSTSTEGREATTQAVMCISVSTSQNPDPSTQGNAMSRSGKPTSQPTSRPTGPSKPTEGADTMQAVVHDTYGTSEVLRLSEVARPTIKDNEVLVRVHAAGLDRGTWHLMTGRPYAARLGFGFRGPRNPVIGRDVAGTVATVGKAVTRFAVGDAVFGIGNGSFAEYTAARADKLAAKPDNVTFEQAGVVAISALTALQAVRDAGRVQAGQHVLIIGASGGVGSYAVQIAKAFGADVTGVASTNKLDLVRSLGADHVIDYTRDDFADGPNRYDVILDIGGNPSLTRLRRALTRHGTAVMVGGEEGGNLTGGMDRQLRGLALSWFSTKKLRGFLNKERSTVLDDIAGLLASGAITPTIDRTYPLPQAPDGMRRLERGEVRGKVAIRV
jgi:NADPH:quinone reductase-like Zn-dependent oxidoreductase